MAAAALRIHGVTIPRREYTSRHLHRMMPLLAKAMKPYRPIKPGPLLAWSGFGGHRIAPSRFRRLLSEVSGNPFSNRYHHPWHTLTVVLHAALLSDRARISKADRDELIFAALSHDLGHRGKRASSRSFAEERRSSQQAIQICFGAGSARRKDTELVRQHIDATAAAWSPKDRMNVVTALLRDADIMASVFHPVGVALQLSQGVMRERQIAMPSREALNGFLVMMSDRGFSHDATTDLAGMMSPQLMAVGYRMKTADTLGFSKGAAQ